MSWRSIDESPALPPPAAKASSWIAETVLGLAVIAGIAAFARSTPEPEPPSPVVVAAEAPAPPVLEVAPPPPPPDTKRPDPFVPPPDTKRPDPFVPPSDTKRPDPFVPAPPPPPPPAPEEPKPLIAVPVPETPRLVVPPAPPRSAEAEAYLLEWKAAAARAAQRDLDGAATLLRRAGRGPEEVRREAGLDLADFDRLREFEDRALARLAATKRGTWLELELRGGAVVSGELGATIRERLELRRGADAAFVECADLSWSALARLGDEDPRALGLAWLLDGRPEEAWEAAGRRSDAFAAKHWTLPRPAAPAPLEASEIEARRLLHEAERLFRSPGTRAAAVAKYRLLLAEFPEAPVVRRSLGRIGARAKAPAETYFGAEDLRGSGTFELGKDGWKTVGAIEFHKARHSFVEAEFEAEPGAPIRAFLRIGGCCEETLTAYGQASGLRKTHPERKVKVAVEPGSIYAVHLKRPELALPKGHAAGHPLRWGWTEIPLPAYPEGGTKRIRVLTEREGLAVGGLLITTSRQAPPTEAELAALEEGRRVE